MAYPDVRRAQPADQHAVGALWEQLLNEQEAVERRFEQADDARARWDNDYEMWLEDETYRIFVAETDGDLAGFATAHRWGPPPIYAESSEVYLDELYVRPDDRRQGLATQLVAAVRNWSGRLGARRLRLTVLARNKAGRAFWAQHDAQPLTMTLTIEQEAAADPTDDEGSKKIGF
jgi:GNAT superfamily N-acetyltransferase